MPRKVGRAFTGVWAVLLSACAAQRPPPAECAVNRSPPAGNPAEVPLITVDPVPAFVEITETTVAALDYATVLAAPKVAQSRPAVPRQDELLGALDAFIRVGEEYKDMIDNDDAPIGPRMAPYAGRLRELVAAWAPSRDVPEPIRAAAREMLAAMGISEPPGGWDVFEGFAARSP